MRIFVIAVAGREACGVRRGGGGHGGGAEDGGVRLRDGRHRQVCQDRRLRRVRPMLRCE